MRYDFGSCFIHSLRGRRLINVDELKANMYSSKVNINIHICFILLYTQHLHLL